MQHKSNYTKGILFGIGNAVLWGTFGVFFTLMLQGGLSEVAVSSVGPTAILLFFGIKTLIKNPGAFKISLKNFIIISGCGGVIISIQFFAAAKALSYVSQGIYTIVEFSHVFLLMVLTSLIFKYKFNRGKVISLILAVIGLCFVLNVFVPDGYIQPMGILWMGINWFSQCALAILLKSVLNSGVDSDVVLVYYNMGAALIYWASCPPWEIVAQVIHSNAVGKLILAIVGFIVLNQLLSTYCWIQSMSNIDPAITNALNAIAPITSLVLGYFIFAEKISLIQGAGVLIVLVSVFVLNKSSDHEESLD
ncbi:MAG: DMT family transporter [Clostridia bacterium]|nr:DMT family transporter [Clostridia bacterium]